MDVAIADNVLPGGTLIAPHGGSLVQAYVSADAREDVINALGQLTRVDVSEDEFHDLEMLGSGAYSPLRGFMERDAWRSVCQDGVLPDGLAWGLPVTLAVTPETASRIAWGEDVALFHRGDPVALLHVTDVFPWRVVLARQGFEADDTHPVLRARREACKSVLLGGEVALLACRHDSFLRNHHLWPRETRSLFTQRGWHRVSAVHVPNPWQRAHEYLLKCALESADGLLLHTPIDEFAQADGIHPAALSVASRLLLTEFFPRDHVAVTPVPRAVFAPGARAALQHAIISQNAGCDTLYLVPPVGVGLTEFRSRTEPAFTRARANGLRLQTAYMASAFHCERCGGIATHKSCPHDDAARVIVSGTEIADTIRRGEQLSLMVTRPEIARALARALADAANDDVAAPAGPSLYPHGGEVSPALRQSLIGHRSCVLWMTGLSGSGKSTIANRLERALLLSGHRVAVLDGDTLRHGLNRDLDFSAASRRENLRRAGEVARIMADAGSIVIASFISPFAVERQMIRQRFTGDFFEIYVEASVEICESRDPKGLYRRARAGQIADFTGLTSPYEPPEQPDLRLDTAMRTVDECVHRLLRFLSDVGILRSRPPLRSVGEGGRRGPLRHSRFQ